MRARTRTRARDGRRRRRRDDSGDSDDSNDSIDSIDSIDADRRRRRRRARSSASSDGDARAIDPGRAAAAAAVARRERLARARRALGATKRDVDEDSSPVVETMGDDDVDPLDAYMAREIEPEVARRAAAETAAAVASRVARAAELAAARARGEAAPTRRDVLEIERDAAIEAMKGTPDEVIEIPTSRVKVLIGPGGVNVKDVARRSKATIQVLKSDAALNASFTGGDLDDANAKARAATQRMLDAVSANVAANRDGERREDASDDDDDDDDDDVLNPREKGSGKVRTDATAPRAMTKIMINGTREARELAKELIEELFARAAEARRQRRADDRERQRDKRARERRVYHLRHAADFERLGLPVGASQDEVKSAFRRLAVRWHPDKHAEGPARVAATEKFAVIQASYNNLLAMEKQIEQGMTLSIAHTAAESATARRPPPPTARHQTAREEFAAALRARVAAAEVAAARHAYNKL